MNVFRIESRRGYGPYTWAFRGRNPKLPYDVYLSAQSCTLPHAIPGRAAVSEPSLYRYGCSTEENLLEYFGPRPLLYLISNHDYYLSTYTTNPDTVLVGCFQLMFRFSDSVRISRRSLKRWLPWVSQKLVEEVSYGPCTC